MALSIQDKSQASYSPLFLYLVVYTVLCIVFLIYGMRKFASIKKLWKLRLSEVRLIGDPIPSSIWVPGSSLTYSEDINEEIDPIDDYRLPWYKRCLGFFTFARSISFEEINFDPPEQNDFEEHEEQQERVQEPNPFSNFNSNSEIPQDSSQNLSNSKKLQVFTYPRCYSCDSSTILPKVFKVSNDIDSINSDAQMSPSSELISGPEIISLISIGRRSLLGFSVKEHLSISQIFFQLLKKPFGLFSSSSQGNRFYSIPLPRTPAMYSMYMRFSILQVFGKNLPDSAYWGSDIITGVIIYSIFVSQYNLLSVFMIFIATKLYLAQSDHLWKSLQWARNGFVTANIISAFGHEYLDMKTAQSGGGESSESSGTNDASGTISYTFPNPKNPKIPNIKSPNTDILNKTISQYVSERYQSLSPVQELKIRQEFSRLFWRKYNKIQRALNTQIFAGFGVFIYLAFALSLFFIFSEFLGLESYSTTYSNGFEATLLFVSIMVAFFQMYEILLAFFTICSTVIFCCIMDIKSYIACYQFGVLGYFCKSGPRPRLAAQLFSQNLDPNTEKLIGYRTLYTRLSTTSKVMEPYFALIIGGFIFDSFMFGQDLIEYIKLPVKDSDFLLVFNFLSGGGFYVSSSSFAYVRIMFSWIPYFYILIFICFILWLFASIAPESRKLTQGSLDTFLSLQILNSTQEPHSVPSRTSVSVPAPIEPQESNVSSVGAHSSHFSNHSQTNPESNSNHNQLILSSSLNNFFYNNPLVFTIYGTGITPAFLSQIFLASISVLITSLRFLVKEKSKSG